MRCFTLRSSGVYSGITMEFRSQGPVIGIGSGENRRYVSVERKFARTMANRPEPCADRGKSVSVSRGAVNPTCSRCGTRLERVERSYRHPDKGEVKRSWWVEIDRASVENTVNGPLIVAETLEESEYHGIQPVLVFIAFDGGRWGSSSVTGLQSERTIIQCSNRNEMLSWDDVQHDSDGQSRCRMCDLPIERSPWVTKWMHPNDGYLVKWSPLPTPGIRDLCTAEYEKDRPQRVERTESLVIMEPEATFLVHITGEAFGPDRLQVTWDGEHFHIQDGRVGTEIYSTDPSTAAPTRRPW